MATTKKAVKKTATTTRKPKTRRFVAIIPEMVNVDDRSPMMEPLELNDANSIRYAEENNTMLEVTDSQFDKIKALAESAVYRSVLDEFRDLAPAPRKSNAGDWIFAIILFGAGVAVGGLLF